MFEKKSKDQNDLDLGEINLLPEDLRSSAQKYQRSNKSKEALYQLRAPKKTKKRRRAFAWLPFFGGTHWEVTPDMHAKQEPAVPRFPEAVAVETNAPKAPEGQRTTSTPNEFGSITPVFGQMKGGSGSVSPKAKRSFKGGISLASFFGRKRPISPMHSAAQANGMGQTEQPSRPIIAPPRHYSLLTDEPVIANQHREAAPRLQNVPTESTTGGITHDLRPITPQTPQHQVSQRGLKPHRPWSLPAWLDIFSLIGMFMRPKKTSQVRPAQKAEAVPAPKPASNIPQSFHAPQPIQPITTSSAPEHMSGQGMRMSPITPVPLPTTEEHGKLSFRAPLTTPTPQHTSKPPKMHTPWHLPKWLDLFYLLSMLRLRRQIRAQKTVKAPASAPTTSAPHATTAPLLPDTSMSGKQAQAPATMPSVSPVTPSVNMKSVMPSLPTTPGPVTPQQAPQTPLVSNDIVPITDTGAPMKQKKSKLHGGILFHVPTKATFATASKELREINLIPGSFFAPRSWKQIGVIIVVVVLLSGGVIGMAYEGLQLWRTQLENRTAEIDTQINSFKDDILIYNKQEPEMSALGTRVELVGQLLSKHIYWTNFFRLLEKYTLADVYYDGVALTAKGGTFTLSAHGPDFNTVTRELQFMNSKDAQEFVTKAVITSAKRAKAADGTERVNFSMDLTLNPNVLYYNAGQN